jgi:hypothetical protein
LANHHIARVDGALLLVEDFQTIRLDGAIRMQPR